MGFRYRKSANFGPFRLNFSKSGIGYSFGGKHARYTKKANGGARTTMSLPGTGISYVKDYSGKPAARKGTSSNRVPATNLPRNKKPFPWRWVAFAFVVLMLIGSFPSIASIFLLIACVLLFPPLQKLKKTIYRGQTLASDPNNERKLNHLSQLQNTKQDQITYNAGCPFCSELPDINSAGMSISYKYTDVICNILSKPYPMQNGSVVYVAKEGFVKDLFGEKIAKIQNDKLCKMIDDYITRGDSITARVLSVDDYLHINIGFYRDPLNYPVSHYLAMGVPYKIYKLIGNQKEDYQTVIENCNEGDAVSINYDWEKEKFAASCVDEIGFFPKSATPKLEESDQALPAYIDHVEENEDGLYSVFVIVFFLSD